MKRNKIIFAIVSFMFVLLVIYTSYIHSKQSEYVQIKQKQSFIILQQIIDGKIIFFRKLISKRAIDKISENDSLKKYIIADDKKYKEEFSKIFKVLKRENKYIKFLHYVSADNICKFELPKGSLEEKEEFKRITREANKVKRAKYGFEVDDHTLLYRLVLPIKYDKKHYGLLEIGVDPKLFISDMTTIERYLNYSTIVSSKKMQRYSNDKLINKIFLNKNSYVLFNDKPLFKMILEENLLDSDIIEFQKESYKLFKYDLLNFDGEIEGKFLITSYITADKKWIDQFSNLTAMFLFILIILIFVVIYFGFDYYDKKIKTLVEQEKQSERLLFQQSKMAAMGEMIGNIAHQWRQPLSTITTAASGLRMQKEYHMLTDEHFENSIEMVMKQAEHMSKTIDDFRNFFQTDKERINFNVKEAVQKDIQLLEASLKNHTITLEVDIDESLEITGHQNEFTQTILNIINNSKDQLNKVNPYIKVIQIKAKIKENTLKLSVQDNAGGIDEDIIDKVFEPYFTTKHQSQGTGIGLFMTAEIITKHFLGKIEVKNKDIAYGERNYKGACFIMSFPLSNEKI